MACTQASAIPPAAAPSSGGSDPGVAAKPAKSFASFFRSSSRIRTIPGPPASPAASVVPDVVREPAASAPAAGGLDLGLGSVPPAAPPSNLSENRTARSDVVTGRVYVDAVARADAKRPPARRDAARHPARQETQRPSAHDDGAGPCRSPGNGDPAGTPPGRRSRAARGGGDLPPPTVAVERRDADTAGRAEVAEPALPPPGREPLDGARADELLRRFCEMWGAGYGIRRNPSPNPISLSAAALDRMNPDEYVVAEKTDGVRYGLALCRCSGGRPVAAMVDRSCRAFEVGVCAEDAFFDGTLLDGELAWEREQPEADADAADADRTETDAHPLAAVGQPEAAPGTRDPAAGPPPARTGRLVFWVFDAACVRGESVRALGYAERFEKLHAALYDPCEHPILPSDLAEVRATELAECGRVVALGNPHALCFRPKPCTLVRHMDALWRSVGRLRHRCDGLIFTPIPDPVVTGAHPRQFKWKHRPTVDLELRGHYRARRRAPPAAASDPSAPVPDADAPSESGGDETDDARCGRWTLGLYYVEADFTVPTGVISATEARPVAPPMQPPPAVPSPPQPRPSGARTSAAADASGVGESAAERRGRKRERDRPAVPDPGQPPPLVNACEGVLYGDADASPGTNGRRAVYFVLERCPLVLSLLAALEARRRRRFACLVECEARFDGPSRLVCRPVRVRTDKSDPNNRHTVLQTMLNVEERIDYAHLRARLVGASRYSVSASVARQAGRSG